MARDAAGLIETGLPDNKTARPTEEARRGQNSPDYKIVTPLIFNHSNLVLIVLVTRLERGAKSRFEEFAIRSKVRRR